MVSVVLSLLLAAACSSPAAALQARRRRRGRARRSAPTGSTARAAARLAWGGADRASRLVLGGRASAPGVEAAAWAAAALFAGFAVAQAAALRAGARGRAVRRASARAARVGRALGRAQRAAGGRVRGAAAAAAREPSTEGWLAIGLAAALLGVAALAVAVLALARELGALRLALGPQRRARDPRRGAASSAARSRARRALRRPRPRPLRARRLHLRGLRDVPRARSRRSSALGRDPLVALRTFDEVARRRRVGAPPTCPAARSRSRSARDGTVLAKGTFNTPASSSRVLAAAERRRGAPVPDRDVGAATALAGAHARGAASSRASARR